MCLHVCGYTQLLVFSVVFYCIFEMMSLTDMKIVDSANLADHGPLEIFLSLPPQTCTYAFMAGFFLHG